ncbi:MAG: tetratricopeptide repeat protein [Methylobacteriaceae bacterium]|nr:tetratricopeptide repeat protein [Methylobacteriaceae bacterium]
MLEALRASNFPRSGDVALSRSFGLILSRAALLALLAGPALAPAASARQIQTVARPFEVSESLAGNYLAALVAGATRDTFAASTYFREVLRADPNNKEVLERAFVASLANGDMPDAFRMAERIVKRDAANGLAQLALGVREVKRKNYAAARGYFSKGGSGRARDVTATLLTAWTHAGGKEGKQAIELIDRLRDTNFEVFRDYHAALVMDLSGQAAEAEKRLKAAYGAEKSTLRLVDAYARFMLKRGDREEALRAYRELAKALPRHPIVVASIADLEAGRPLPPFVRTPDQGAAEVLYGLGAAGGRQGDELAAIIYLRLALHLTPDNAMALMTLADLYERLKQYERAIDVYAAVPAASPLRPSADIQAGLTLESLGRTEDAVKQLRALVDERPQDVDALTALGNLDNARKNYAEALAVFDRAIALVKPEPGYWSLWYRRGIAHERLKNWPPAEADFKKALELFPDQPLVLNYLGYSWVDRGMNLEEAFKMLRRAVELRPTDGYIVDSLGWAHYKLGRYDEAVKELERAIELKPADPVINDHLGDAYWKTGRKLEATFQWNHARDMKPEPEDLVKILKKIQYGLDEAEKPASAETQTSKSGG